MPQQDIVNRMSHASVLPFSGRMRLNVYDVLVIIVMMALFLVISYVASDMTLPLPSANINPIILDPWNLIYYGMRSTLRMFLAIIASLFFTVIVATLAAKNKRAGPIILPILDILQSVPILGFLTFTVVFFLNLFPGSEMGAECAA